MRDSKQGSLMKPRKSRRPDVQTAEALGCNRDKKEQNNAHNTLGDTVSSDSRLLHKVNSEDKSLHPGEKELCKNPAKNLNDQENRMSETEENDTLKNMPDVKDIGPDTQIAAEAMETLCFEVHLADNNDNHPNIETSNLVKATTRTRSSNKSAHLQECPTTDLSCPTSVGGGRQAKRKTRAGNASSEPLPKESKQTRPRCNTVLEQAAPRSKDELSVSPCHANESAGKRSALKSGTKETLLSTPVAHRTRNSTDLKQPKPAINSFDVHEEIKELLSAPVQRKKRTPRKHKNVKMVTIEQLKKIRLAALDQAKKTYLDKSNAPNIEGVTNDQGKRPRRETTVEQEADEEYSRNFKRPREVEKRNTEVPSAKGANINCEQGASPKEKYRTPVFSRGTPGDCATPVKNVSPVCMGDEYHKQSRLKNISRHSLIKEINSLVTDSPGKDLRKRKDITNVKILFSQHLHEDVIKQQKKILSRVKGTVASSMSDATHFVADEFVRTRNMLEAIASGKPVVTHLWLESCGQANCLIDEKTYILRDARKEREFGFSLPVSLARAVRHPLLQGHRVFVTPNTKPGRDILANLVNAVHGVVIERLGRSIFKDDKLPNDLLILSCEEDYDICVPFLEKDGFVYSSELLLNGILKQKLEYERHQLFANKIRRTRSTTWVKKKNQYCPVTKGK